MALEAWKKFEGFEQLHLSIVLRVFIATCLISRGRKVIHLFDFHGRVGFRTFAPAMPTVLYKGVT
jgi:hypothetical protein